MIVEENICVMLLQGEKTNYVINSKTVATVKSGYTVEKISVAVVVNKGRIAKMVCEPADQAKIDAYLADKQKIVTSAVGYLF